MAFFHGGIKSGGVLLVGLWKGLGFKGFIRALRGRDLQLPIPIHQNHSTRNPKP